MKALVLFSGGLDSTTCLAMAIKAHTHKNVIALSLSYGQKHIKEIESANKIAKIYGVDLIEYDVSDIFKNSKCGLLASNDNIPLSSYDEQLKGTHGDPVQTYVPFRNGLFLSIAASLAITHDCGVIYYGIHKDDAAGNAYPDCSKGFNENIAKAIYIGTGGKVSVNAPFVQSTKVDIVRVGLSLDVPYQYTWSCYNGGDKPCGKCGTCIDRKKAFEANGVVDLLRYEGE